MIEARNRMGLRQGLRRLFAVSAILIGVALAVPGAYLPRLSGSPYYLIARSVLAVVALIALLPV
jgi:glucose dehydrogenase